MKNNYEIDDFIGIFPNAVPKDYCEDVIKHYEYMNSINRVVSRQQLEGNIQQIHKKTDTYFFENERDPIVIQNNALITGGFIQGVWSSYGQYIQKYGIITSLEQHRISESVKIQKTEPAGGYHIWHCEQGSALTGRRLMLAILYLNDVEEGGETEFLYQGKRVYAEQGTLILCPASFTHTHRGNPPLKGNKYIMNTWLEFVGA
jgi:hypothetical protein